MNKLYAAYKLKRRFFSLMEVMISFVLILFCLVPLIYPNIAMYREQNKFTEKIKLDHAVTILYGNLLESLHRRGVSFEQLVQGSAQPITIPPDAMVQAGFDPNESAYTVSLTAQKEFMKGEKTGRYVAALVKFIYSFRNKSNPEDTITFTYRTPIVKLKPASERSTEEENNGEKNSQNQKGKQASVREPKEAFP